MSLKVWLNLVLFVFFFLFCFVPVSLYVSQAFLLHKLVAILLLQFSKCWNCRCNHRAWLNWSSLHSYCIRDLCSAPFPMSVLREKLKATLKVRKWYENTEQSEVWCGGHRRISLGQGDGSRFVFVRVSNSSHPFRSWMGLYSDMIWLLLTGRNTHREIGLQ